MNRELAVNPFGKAPAMIQESATAVAHIEKGIQEVQAAMTIAKKFPRNQLQAMDRILNACTRPSLADTALYSYTRGGNEITGPSIRLAECLAQQWGNINYGIRELSASDGVSTVEAFAWDLETNTKQVKEFQVKHWRHTRQGGYKLEDPRDIYELIANNGARRLRACLLGVIPGDVTERAVQQCELTQQSSVEVTPESIKAMASAFSENYKVSAELIEKRIGKRLEAINAPQLLSLRKIYQSLKDGMSKPSDWFDIDDVVSEPKTATSDLSIKPKAEPKKEEEKPGDVDVFGALTARLLKTKTEDAARKLLDSKDFDSLDNKEQERFAAKVENHSRALAAGMDK